jgi:hypothetical protein
MRKSLIALPLVLLMASCSTFTWKGQRSGVTDDQAARGIKDVAELTRQYETEKFWSSVRARRDGRVNALSRDFNRIQNTIDRHLFNYSPTDPFVNHRTNEDVWTTTGQFGTSVISRGLVPFSR